MTASNADFHFVLESDCLNVRAIGRYVLVQKEAAVKAIAAAIEAQPVKAALVDIREVPGPYTFMDRYELGELAGRFLRQVPIAIVALEEQTDKERIGKMAARNRGANLEVFTDLAEAQAWLQKYLTPTG
jgi:hypothetical protein